MGRPKKFDPEVAVAKAMHTFWVGGYAETSPQELADSLDIGKGSLYHTFGSKHDLFVRSLEHYAGISAAELTAVMDEPTPIRVRVRKLLTSFVETDLDDPDRCGCFVVNTTVELGVRDDDVARIVRRSVRRTEEVLTGAFVAAQRAGEIAANQDPRALAKLVQSSMIGLRILARTADHRDQLQPVVEAAVQAI